MSPFESTWTKVPEGVGSDSGDAYSRLTGRNWTLNRSYASEERPYTRASVSRPRPRVKHVLRGAEI